MAPADALQRHQVLVALGIVDREPSGGHSAERHMKGLHDQDKHAGTAARIKRALADILDDVNFEAVDGTSVYLGIREDGVMDLGIGDDGPVGRFSYRDAEKLDDAAFALWRQREPGDDEGLIADAIIDTEGQRIYLAIGQKTTYTADPNDPDDEDITEPVLTIGIPTSRDSEDEPDFHEADLDEDGFDAWVGNLQRLAEEYEQVDVASTGINEDFDAILMSDHRIWVSEGEGDPASITVDEADQVAAATGRLLDLNVPEFTGESPDVLDSEDIDNLSVSVLEDGSFLFELPTEDGGSRLLEFDRDSAARLVEALREMAAADSELPGGFG